MRPGVRIAAVWLALALGAGLAACGPQTQLELQDEPDAPQEAPAGAVADPFRPAPPPLPGMAAAGAGRRRRAEPGGDQARPATKPRAEPMCQNCGQPGHKKPGCKDPPVPKEDLMAP